MMTLLKFNKKIMMSLKFWKCIFLQHRCQIRDMGLKLCTSFQNWIQTFCISAPHNFGNRKIVEYCIKTVSSLCLDIALQILHDTTLSIWCSSLDEKANYDRTQPLPQKHTSLRHQAHSFSLFIFRPVIFLFLFVLFVFLNRN